MKKSNCKLTAGLILIVIGGAFLIQNFMPDLFSIPYYLESWQAVVVLIGFVIAATSSNYVFGFIVMAYGLIDLLDEYFYYGLWGDVWTFWPLLLIILGLAIVLGKQGFSLPAREKAGEGDYIDDFSIFGGKSKQLSSKNFIGGRTAAIFGGSEVNLRHCELAEGDNYLDVFAMFGGFSLRVPEDWDVVIKVTPILGGIEDERIIDKEKAVNPKGRLIIKGFVMFGGGEIKS